MNQLKVWWIPQVPGKTFEVLVDTPKEAAKLLDILGDYDLFQLENDIKPDYTNAGGVMMLDDDGEWVDWYDKESGEDDIYLYLRESEL